MLFEIGLPRKFAKWSKILWKFGSFGKEFRWTKFNAVEGVSREVPCENKPRIENGSAFCHSSPVISKLKY